MFGIIRRIWDRITRFVRFLNEAVKALATVLAILTAVGFSTALVGFFSSNSPLVLVGTTSFVLSVLIVIVLYTTAESFFTHNELGKSEVKVQFKKVYYKYFPDSQTMEHGKYYKIVALRDGVTQFVDRYAWTGRGKVNVQLVTPGQKLVEDRAEFWHLNKIVFDVPMKKGESREIALRWDLFDDSRSAVPFLSQPVDYPTDRLMLLVTLPSRPKEIYSWHFSDYLALDSNQDRLIEKKTLEYDMLNGEIIYDISRPRWGHKFKISWVP